MKTIKTIFWIIASTLVIFLVMSFIEVNTSKQIRQIQRPGSNGFAVVELFTSEGCSSCPPADELIERIRKENKNSRLYLLAYHVDYWNHQGWKDRFSKPEFTERQSRYASWMNLQTIYTPQVVINGESEHVGSNRMSVVSDITSQLQKASAEKLRIDGVVNAGELLIHHNASLQKNEQLLIALIEKNASSEVKAGENMGRNLSHVQIVRELIPVDAKNNKPVSIKVPADFSASGWELIGFVQNKENGHISDAASFDWEK